MSSTEWSDQEGTVVSGINPPVSSNLNFLLLPSSFGGILFSVCCGCSLCALGATLLLYCFFSELRRRAVGKCLRNMIGSLMLAELGLLAGPHFHDREYLCCPASMIQHFCCMASFLWSTTLAYDTWDKVRREYVARTVGSERKLFRCYSFYSWGLSTTVVFGCWVGSRLAPNVLPLDIIYNVRYCGVLGKDSLAIPLLILFLANLGLFFATAWKVMGPDTEPNQSEAGTQRDRRFPLWADDGHTLKAYFTVSTVMFCAWLTGYVVANAHAFSAAGGAWLYDDWWIIYVFLNASQGFAVLFIFGLSPFARRLVRQTFWRTESPTPHVVPISTVSDTTSVAEVTSTLDATHM